jgi:hypothetical protein
VVQAILVRVPFLVLEAAGVTAFALGLAEFAVYGMMAVQLGLMIFGPYDITTYLERSGWGNNKKNTYKTMQEEADAFCEILMNKAY